MFLLAIFSAVVIEIYIDALLPDTGLADRVWEWLDSNVITAPAAVGAWLYIQLTDAIRRQASGAD